MVEYSLWIRPAMFSYHEIKKVLYIFQSLLGVILFIIGLYSFQQTTISDNPISHVVTGIVLLVVGFILVFFGVETYLIRDDQDVWR
jgi:uncharacterized membrane protein